MKLKLELSAEIIINDIDDFSPTEFCTAEQNKALVEDMLRESFSQNASINIRDCKLTTIS